MGLHKTKLKAAVSKYSGFFKEGNSEEEVKAEIAKDDKKYTPEEISEIYETILTAPAEGKPDLLDKLPESKEALPKVPEAPKKEGKPDEQPPAAEKPKSSNYVVSNSFRDIADFTRVYLPGEDVSHFAAERLAHLVSIGMVENPE